jgi:lipoprotein-releasing system permease protein
MELFIALRYLRGKRKLGFVSIITDITAAGVFLGTFVLIIALSVANGFEKEVRDRIVGTLAHAKILQYHGRPIDKYDSLRQIVLSVPGVVAAAPYIMGKVGIECNQTQEGAMVMGIDPRIDSTVSELPKSIKNGVYSLDSAESGRNRLLPGIILGMGMADKFGVRQGSEVVLLSLVPVDGEIDPVPKMMRFVVRGVFETGMYEYDLSLVYISIAAAQSLFGIRGVEGIQIKTVDMFRADQISKAVKDSLGGYPYKSENWQSQNRSLFQWMKLEKLIIFIVISMILVVASFNIVSSLIMMIMEKRREIGILMSMGGSSAMIRRIFLLYGIIIGFFGSTLGTILGVALCYIQFHWQLIPLPGDIYFINKVPVLLKTTDILAVYITTNLICIGAALVPAWLASRMLPAESIRYE